MEKGDIILDKRYTVIRKLGAGAFGELWKVEKKKALKEEAEAAKEESRAQIALQ